MQEIKTIVVDVDGTLLNDQQEIMPITKKVLQTFQQDGGQVVLASGRDLISISKIGAMLDMEDYKQNAYICLNGLETYTMDHQLIHQATPLHYQDAMFLGDLAVKYQFDCILFLDDGLYIIENGQTHIIDDHFKTSTKHIVLDHHQINKERFTHVKKIALIQQSQHIDQYLSMLQQAANGYDVCRIEKDWIEITKLDCNKGTAIEALLQHNQDLLNHTIAFGNGENDCSMLQIVGHGVAMDNAFESVKQKVLNHCLSNQEDGVGKYLQQYIQNKN